ncbi:hypothetical protein BDW02DRAFT_599196 [Decorospora gaudefroyi]|uniref:Uncharacterized protein n=1 Tax=Decorospora gaudefroyi TaxID=184978 RepID=A0A6A5K7M4_9PLEO|nr:hypothetical protein BDW02DRAFT_599196 [Decorospora gaudefroyi]
MENPGRPRPSQKRTHSALSTYDDGIRKPPALRTTSKARIVNVKTSHTQWVTGYSSTADCQRNNLLLRLPAELRNRIYNHVLGGRTYRFKDTFRTSQARLDHRGEQHILGLLYVCRQIHFETALLPYTLNTFSFRDLDISLEPFLRHRSPSQIRSIHSLELVTYRAGQMWASIIGFSKGLSSELRMLGRLPNLQQLRIIVHMMSSLYIAWGAIPWSSDFEVNLEALERALEAHMPQVVLRSFQSP